MTDDLISRQAAIKALHDEIVRKRISEDENDGGALDEFDTEAILRRLPSAQPEQTDCDYCHENINGFVKPIEKNCHAAVHVDMYGWHIALKAKGWAGRAPINFCPMCGRRLKHG